MQAYKIFEAKGMEKLMKEVSSKLRLVNSAKKSDIRIHEEEKALMSEEGKGSSGSPSPDKPVGIAPRTTKPASKGKKKGKKKLATGAKQLQI